MFVKRIWQVTVCAASHWVSDDASTIGAALAFYSAFSLAPLLVLLVSGTGLLVGADIAYSFLGHQLTSLFGSATADTLIQAARHSQTFDGVVATIISVSSLLVGATTIFSALESALELIWGSKALAPSGIRGFIRSRLLSFGFILAVGFLLLISLTLSTGLAALRSSLLRQYPGWVSVFAATDVVVSVALSTTLFALVYRYMPARRVPWRQVALGALITALLFQLGRWGIGFYLGKSTQASAFGAAASFVALLLWLYYSAQIFLFGAEFTSCLAGLRSKAHLGHSDSNVRDIGESRRVRMRQIGLERRKPLRS